VYADAKHISEDLIPVVDISPLSACANSSANNLAVVAAALHAASQGLGFIYVKGHGIPADLIEAARQYAYQFFRSSDQSKGEVLISDRHRGWLRPGAAKMQDDAKADLKESFRVLSGGIKMRPEIRPPTIPYVALTNGRRLCLSYKLLPCSILIRRIRWHSS